MQSFRLKNIIILILALLNIFLLFSLSSRKTAQQESRQRIQSQLVELFAADSSGNITLDPDAISFQTPPVGGTLVRDVEHDRKMASFLLGEGLTYSDQGGGIYSYDSSAGAAVFRSGGNFDASLHLSADTDAESFCKKLCKTFQYENLTFQTADGHTTATAVRSFNGYLVANCTITFSIDGDSLNISGTLLPDSMTPAPGTDDLSGPAALTAFLNARRETGAVVSEITEMYPCYELQNTAAAAMTLTPAWCISTSAGLYYVNCYTGAVTHE